MVAAIDPGLRTLAHDGDAAYRDQFELVRRRSAAQPNEQWQADHTLLDLQVLDAQQKPARPWLTVVLDDHSRAVAGTPCSWATRPPSRPRWRCTRPPAARPTRPGR